MRTSFAIILLSASLAAPGCGAEIGDSCTTNVECSPSGDRICDTSQLDGYCTIEGCDIDSCPEEAVCIRFFPTAFLSVPCNPQTEDMVDPRVSPSNDCTQSEICLSSGFCALFSQESRFCMKRCESKDDCRDGYECRATGTRGAEGVPNLDKPGFRTYRFCAQKAY